MSKAAFPAALELTLRFEGGYVDHAADPGGATKFGITRAVLAEWRGRAVGKADVSALKRPEAEMIYRRLYWEAAGCDRLPAGVDIAVFDFAVNSGVRRAVLALQAMLGVERDGRVGPLTLAAAQACDPVLLVRALGRRRRGFLASLRIFPIFGRGWLRRVDAVEAAACRVAAPPEARTQTFDVPIMTRSNLMQQSKSALASRTVWANLIGLAALGAQLLGFETGDIDQSAVVDALLNVLAGASFVASTVFRIGATRRIG